MVNYFFQGLIILAPIVITAWAVLSLFNYIDDILPNLLHVLFPDLVKLNPQGEPEKIPGLGFLVVVLIVVCSAGHEYEYGRGLIVDCYVDCLRSPTTSHVHLHHLIVV